ncbi:MAG: acylphosphatase [Nanoarchaeota archaeon]
MKRIRILIVGKVISIFFRAFIKENAEQLGLTGWVRNTKDGSVEAVFEGQEQSIEKIIRICKKGPPLARIDDIKITEEKPENKFKSFEIIY